MSDDGRVELMKVQKICLPEQDYVSWVVLDDDYLIVEPIAAFLSFCENIGRSPNAIRSSAHHLKLFWEFLREKHVEWTEVDVAHLAAFVSWLRQENPVLLSLEQKPAARTDATIDQMLTAVHSFYDFQMRMKTVPDLPLYRFLMMPNRRYKPFLYGIAKMKPVQSRVIKVKREQHRVKTLTQEQIQQTLDACHHQRDRFLLSLLFDGGIRIGQALGLHHEDIRPEDNEIEIVPRQHNTNGARAKTRESYSVPVSPSLMQLYTDYLIDELSGLEVDALPDYVFVNLWEGEIGRPLTYATVRSLLRRIEKKTGIHVTAHMYRHSRATMWIRDDHLPLAMVSRLLGHASVSTTQATYVHLTAQDLRAVLEGKRGQV